MIKEQAFTLIEVIIAIVILAASLSVLLGLQSSAITKALRDRNQLQAMLAARSVMAVIEIQKELENRSTNTTLVELFQELSVFPEADFDAPTGANDPGNSAMEAFEQMNATLIIEEQENPEILQSNGITEPILKRVELVIDWGESPDQQMRTVYFVRAL